MPRNRAERIREKIRAYADDPESQANTVTSLRNRHGLVRLQVGGWRIIMRNGTVLQILSVASRDSAYRGMAAEE